MATCQPTVNLLGGSDQGVDRPSAINPCGGQDERIWRGPDLGHNKKAIADGITQHNGYIILRVLSSVNHINIQLESKKNGLN